MGRPIRITAPGTVIDDGSSGANWSVTGTGAVENAAASILLPDGTYGNRVSFTSGSGQDMFITCTTALSPVGKHGFEIDIHMSGCTDGARQRYDGDLRVRDAGAANNYYSELQLLPGWNRIRLGKGNFGVLAGAPNWESTTFTNVLVKVNALASQTLTATVNNLRYSGNARPQIAIVFDDGYTEVIDTAKAILDAFGFPATVGVIGNEVGASGKMTLAQLNALHDADWRMCNHSFTHGAAPFLDNETQAQCFAEIDSNQRYLKANGFTRDNEHLHYIAPYGENSTAYFAAADQAGCLAFYGGGVGNNAIPNAYPSSDCWVTNALSAYPRLTIVNTGWTGAQALAFVDRCIMSGKSMVVCLHKITGSPTTDLDWSTTHFTTFVKGLYARSAMLDVVTLPEYYSRIKEPTV